MSDTWEVSAARGADGEYLVVGGTGKEFGLIASVTDEADAYMIAAARDMYEALKWLTEATGDDLNDGTFVGWGKAAEVMSRATAPHRDMQEVGG